MEHVPLVAFLLAVAAMGAAQQPSGGPTNEKAKKTFQEALAHESKQELREAFDSYKKADKQDDGKCFQCERKIAKYGFQFQDWKAAENAAIAMVANAADRQTTALSHYQLGMVYLDKGLIKNDQASFPRAHEELSKAVAAYSNFPDAIYADGQALAYMKQDEAAKLQFVRFVALTKPDDPMRQRAQRFLEQPELARARMAPAFAVETLDGQHVSLDDLKGKVVLLDFWATWCPPCREALPHIRKISQKFQGLPFVVLSISLDEDEGQWKQFVAKNEMTWLQYRDGGFEGPVARLFNIHAIPQTFTIDADGVLQDQHIGDEAIEGKLKKLVAHAQEVASSKPMQ